MKSSISRFDCAEAQETSSCNLQTTEWNCQDYVLEALELFYDKYVIDEDDKNYNKGTKKAKEKYYGPRQDRRILEDIIGFEGTFAD